MHMHVFIFFYQCVLQTHTVFLTEHRGGGLVFWNDSIHIILLYKSKSFWFIMVSGSFMTDLFLYIHSKNRENTQQCINVLSQ